MKIKKMLAVISALCMMCAVVPFSEKYVPETAVSASAEGEEEYTEGTYEYLEYKKYADYVEISGVTDFEITEAVIPAEIDGLLVTSIGNYAFYYCSGLTSVNIPDGVTSIGRGAFLGCSSLTSVTIPKDLTNIGASSFSDTPWLEAKQAENPLVVVNDILIDGITCKGEVVIPDGVTSIGTEAFFDCFSLTSITIPESVISIGDNAFSNCYSLTSVTIPESVTNIGVGAFLRCSGLTSVTIPGSVTSIGDGAFGMCYSLTSVTILEGATSIGTSAFKECSSLISVTIPKSVTSIGVSAFDDTPWLEAKQAENSLVVVNDILIDGSTCKGEVIIPDGVTSIGSGAFYACTDLTSVTIPDSVTSIGELAFAACSDLTFVTIPKNLTNIGLFAFVNTPWLETKQTENPLVVVNNILIDGRTCKGEVVIPNDVTSIGVGAFFRCPSLTSVAIPESVTSIGVGTFGICSDLASVIIKNPDCEIDGNAGTISNGSDENNNYYFNGTIYGYENSTAQAYAEKWGYKFESLGTAPETTEIAPGDADNSGKVDILDVITVNKAILGKEKLTDEQLKAIDFNGDGKPDASDSLKLMKFIVGLITSLTE